MFSSGGPSVRSLTRYDGEVSGDPWIKPGSPALQADSLPFELQGRLRLGHAINAGDGGDMGRIPELGRIIHL